MEGNNSMARHLSPFFTIIYLFCVWGVNGLAKKLLVVSGWKFLLTCFLLKWILNVYLSFKINLPCKYYVLKNWAQLFLNKMNYNLHLLMDGVFVFFHCNCLKVVTFKNNALDHFLEECLDSSPKASIVRVGGASSSDRLKEHLLTKVKYCRILVTNYRLIQGDLYLITKGKVCVRA